MYFTIRKLSPILKLPWGKSVWAEKSQMRLPNKSKKLDFGLKGIGAIFIFTTFSCYVLFQSQFNPDSVHARFVNYIRYEIIPNVSSEKKDEDTLYPDAVKIL